MTLSGKQILVVDKDEFVRYTLAEALGNAGAEVQTASSASEAVDWLERYRPHLVVFHLNLPDTDPFAFVEALGAGGPLPALVAITGRPSAGAERVARDVGCARLLAKPVDLGALIETAKTLLGGEDPGPAAPTPGGEPRPRVLVVDDDELVLYTAREVISSIAVVETSASAPKGIERMAAEPFDLLLIDLKMPDLDGIAFIRKARRLRPEALAIIMTGYPEIESAVSGFKEGVYDYLIKPLEPVLLRAVVLRAWDKLRLQRQRYRLFREFERAQHELEGRATELREKNRALEEKQAEVVDAERVAALGQLAAGLAHDFGNPLGIAHSIAQTMHTDLSSRGDDLQEYSGNLLKHMDRLRDILNGLRQLSVGPCVELQPADLGEVARQAGDLVAPECRRRGIEFVQRLERIAGRWDVAAHRQLIVNLLVNAMDAIGEAPGGLITLTSRLKDRGSRAEIEVTNNGPAIPDTDLARIFKPLFTTKTRGLGLGLWLGRRAARTAGGDLRARNLGERGVAFVLELPVEPPSDALGGRGAAS